MSAVQDLIDWTDNGRPNISTKTQHVADRQEFEMMMAESMEDRMRRVGVCEDMNHNSDPLAGAVVHALRFTLNTSSYTTTCGDFQHFCTHEDAILLRFSCPVTCGCRDPRSGLLQNGPSHGCPRDVCEDHDAYQEALDHIA